MSFFLRLKPSLWCGWTMHCSSIHPSVNTWVAPTFRLLCVMLPWTCVHASISPRSYFQSFWVCTFRNGITGSHVSEILLNIHLPLLFFKLGWFLPFPLSIHIFTLQRWSHMSPEELPGGASGKEPTCQYRRHLRLGFHPYVGKIPPVLLPGESPWTEEPGGL